MIFKQIYCILSSAKLCSNFIQPMLCDVRAAGLAKSYILMYNKPR
jgi:hypothetical protein